MNSLFLALQGKIPYRGLLFMDSTKSDSLDSFAITPQAPHNVTTTLYGRCYAVRMLK